MPAHQENDHYGFYLDGKYKDYSLLNCIECGFYHVMPIPTDDVLSKFYADFYSTHKPNYIKEREEDRLWWDDLYNEIYDIYERFLPLDAKQEVFDFGCGPGFFLLTGKNRGWATRGIDASKEIIEYARTLGVEAIQDYGLQDDPVSCINLYEVLEHYPDPSKLLMEVKKCLRQPYGIVSIVVPNDFNPLQLMLLDKVGFDPYWIAPPEHINYFNLRSLSSLLIKRGFKILYETTTFPMELFLLMGLDYTKNPELGRQCHKQRVQLEFLLGRKKRGIYDALTSFGIGRECVVFATPN